MEKQKNTKFDLAYYVFSNVVVGSVGGVSICVEAVSGGARGSISGKSQTTFASFNPRRAKLGDHRESGSTRGGPIPPGLWRIEKPSLYKGGMKGITARLIPIGNQITDYSSREYVKLPFLIHGTGQYGSDGCIVIEREKRARLLNAVEKAGGAILLVTMVIDGNDGFSRSEKFQSVS